MTQQQHDEQDLCPGSGQTGRMDESAPGDDWYVICSVCGARWAGGNLTVEPHKDWRTG